MCPPRKQGETLGSLFCQFGLGQNAAPHGNHGVGGEDVASRQIRIILADLANGLCLCFCEAFGQRPGLFVLLRCFVQISWLEGVGLDADLLQQL